MFHNFLQTEAKKGEKFLHAEPRGSKECPGCSKSIGSRSKTCKHCQHDFRLTTQTYNTSAELQRQLDASNAKSARLQHELDTEKAKSARLQHELDTEKAKSARLEQLGGIAPARPRVNSLDSNASFGGGAASPNFGSIPRTDFDGLMGSDLSSDLSRTGDTEGRIGNFVLKLGKMSDFDLINILNVIEIST